jgi:hypothetical protein
MTLSAGFSAPPQDKERAMMREGISEPFHPQRAKFPTLCITQRELSIRLMGSAFE